MGDPSLKDYDASSVDSIVKHARKLKGKSLSQVADLPSHVSDSKNKGKLGDLVEKYWFEIFPSNVNHLPDFADAGVELKTTGVKQGKNGEYRAKERLVLTKINPVQIRDEHWGSSTFLKKCRLLLVLFYLYEKEKPEIEREFVLEPKLMDILKLEPQELTQIIHDWTVIRDKCVAKLAHELSEGDTTYLKACRKGSGGDGESQTVQGDESPLAKGRAFSFPASFITRQLANDSSEFTRLVEGDDQTVEESARTKIEPYLGKPLSEIWNKIDFKSTAKNKNSLLVKALLTGATKDPLEFVNAGIVMRTITLSRRGVPTEDMPFSAFDPIELVQENWENSSLSDDLENRYWLVVFQQNQSGDDLILRSAGFWTMPYRDRLTAQNVWAETIEKFKSGDYGSLPKLADSPIVFVRTHGKNREDKVLTVRGDYTERRSFWIGKHYLANVIESGLEW